MPIPLNIRKGDERRGIKKQHVRQRESKGLSYLGLEMCVSVCVCACVGACVHVTGPSQIASYLYVFSHRFDINKANIRFNEQENESDEREIIIYLGSTS